MGRKPISHIDFVASIAINLQVLMDKKEFTKLLGKKVRCNNCKKIVNKAVEAMRSDFSAFVCPYCKKLWIEWGRK